MLESLATEGMDVSMRMDLAAGVFYMNMAAKGMDLAGLDPNAWYKMDLAALTEQAGVEAMAMSQSLDMEELLNTMLTSGETINSTDAYSELKAMMEGLCAIFADDNFVLDENGLYTATYSTEMEGMAVDCRISLGLTDDTVSSFEVVVIVGEENMGVSLGMRMDAEGKMKAEMNLAISGGMITGTLTMEGGYTQGTTAPETQPPVGATVLDMNDLDALTGVLPLPEEA